MGSHGAEAARYLFGKDLPVRDVFAWGATLVHGDKTTGEDNAVMLVRFEDDRVATMDVSWSSKGGLENRFEAYGDAGRIVEDITSTTLRAFIERPAGYLGEKVDADTGWVFPVPDEPYAHGHDAMMRHLVETFRDGVTPRETFRDGFIVNAIIDAAYRSMRSGTWEPVQADIAVAVAMTSAVAPDLPWIAEADRSARAPRRRPRPTPSSRPASGAPTRSRRTAWSTCSGRVTRGCRSRRCSRATARIPASTPSPSCR